jgi:hypothetical protein
LMRAPYQSVTDASGREVTLTPYRPGFDINNPTTLQSLGELRAMGGTDTTSQQLNAIATPAQKAEADRLWSIEKARLEEIDRVNALKAQQDAVKAQQDQGVNRGAASQAGASPSAVPKGFIESLTAIPNVTDEKIVAAMKLAKVSPKNLADALGISEGEVAARVAATVPYGQSVTLGDTIIAPQYRVTGSGETQEIGALETIYTSKTTGDPNYRAPVGSEYQQYNADGTFQRTGTTQAVAGSFFGGLKEAFSDPVVIAALLGGAAASGVFSGLGAGAGAGTGTGLLTGGVGTALGTGTGLTAGSSLSGLTAGSTLSGLTAGTGALTGANTLLGGASLGSTLGALTTGAGALTAGATALTASQIADLTKAGLNATQIGSLLSGGATTAGGLLQQQTSREAAQKAQQMIEAETAAAKQAAQFRPIGMTTRFGTSQFTVDPVTGQLTSAGYTASPGVLEAQDRLVALGNQGLAQAEAAQGQFAPLQTGAQRLFGLGNQYLAESPEAVAQNYLNQQMALLQPGRELELANLQNRLQQQGRGGLAVAQGGTLGATTPELQALFNARAQQEAQLAANAQQYGQQNVLFGAGLLGQGSQAMGQYYGGQQAAYAPYTTALGQFTNLEQLAQQPLTLSTGLAQQSAQAGANMGQLGLRGAQLSTALATGQAATTNPYATVLSGLGSSSTLGQGLGGLLGGGLQSAFSQTGVGSSGFGSGLAYGNQDLGLFL